MLIRRMEAADVSRVAEIEKDCFSLPWSEQSLMDSISRKDTLFLVCEDSVSNIVGYIGMYLSFEEGDITNVAVAPLHRKKGYGEALVSRAKLFAKEQGLECILLEVRVSNDAAISLYHKMGFEKLGLRKKFYEHPTEDALIMSCTL